MNRLKFISILLIGLILSSFALIATPKTSVKITRFMIAKAGSQIIEYEDGQVMKVITNRYPLAYKLHANQNNKLLEEFKNIDKVQLTDELEKLPEINKGVYPKIYYKIITDADTITTKEFFLQSMPNQLKKMDKLLLMYSSGTY